MRITIIIISAILFYSFATNAQDFNNSEIYEKKKIDENYSFFNKKSSDRYNKKYGLLKNDKQVLPAVFKRSYNSTRLKNRVLLSFNGLKGLYNLENNKWSIPIKYEKLFLRRANMYEATLNGKNGIIDANNKIIINFEWNILEPVRSVENYYKVKKTSKSNNFGLLNIVTKKLIIPCEYSSIEKVDNSNYFKVKKNGKYNLIDIDNKVLFKKWYDELYLPVGGRKLYIVKINDKMGVINKNEKEIVPIKYIDIQKKRYKDGSHLAKNEAGLYGCISLDGRITMPFQYTSIENKNTYNENNIIAKNKNKCGIIRVNDGMPYEIATCDYDEIEAKDKLFIVEKNNKYGLMDIYGNMLTKVIFDEIKSVSNSNSYYGRKKMRYYIAIKDNKYVFFNSDGEKTKTLNYKEIKPSYTFNDYGKYITDKQYVAVKANNKKYGLVDILGKVVIPQKFDNILCRKGNHVIVKNNKKIGIYNIILQKTTVDIKYDQIFWSKNGLIAKLGNKFFDIKLNTPVEIKKINFEF